MADIPRGDFHGNGHDKNRLPSTTLSPTNVDSQGDRKANSELVAQKKKPTSFQITSVTVQGSRLSNDGGDDSADDLDESHTEDLSSEILDYSKTPDLDNDQSSEENSNANTDDLPSLSLQSVNSVKSVIGETMSNVQSVDTSTDTAYANLDASASSNTIVSGHMPDYWHQRFKVVKIVSSEPFKRGRWLCMDFIDPPTVQQETKQELSEITGLSASTNILNCDPGEPSHPKSTVAHVYEISANNSYPPGISVTLENQTPQPLYGIFLPATTTSQGNPISTFHTLGIHSSPILLDGVQVPGISQPLPVQCATAPTQHQIANLPPSNIQMQPQPVAVSVNPPTVQALSQSLTSSQTKSVVTQPTLPVTSISIVNQPPPSLTPQQITIPSQQPVSLPVTSIVPPQSHPVQPASSVGVMPLQTTISVQQPSQPLQAQVIGNKLSSQTLAIVNQTVTSADNVSHPPSNTDTQNFPSQGNETLPIGNQKVLADALLPGALNSPAKVLEGDEAESVPSGTSTVAIDNKIEQAMDLVKSHLMFAVREEVDVLKERISELTDRISQLEQENVILRANATPETLNLLNQSQIQAQASQHIGGSTQQAPIQSLQTQPPGPS